MKLQKVNHMGIPVENFNRAKDFYTNVLGMEYLGRAAGNPKNPDSFPVHGVAQKLDRFKCGSDDVVVFERSRAIQRDALDQDGIAHQAFDMNWEDYDDALKTASELGNFTAASNAIAAIRSTCSTPRAIIWSFTSQDLAAGAKGKRRKRRVEGNRGSRMEDRGSKSAILHPRSSILD